MPSSEMEQLTRKQLQRKYDEAIKRTAREWLATLNLADLVTLRFALRETSLL